MKAAAEILGCPNSPDLFQKAAAAAKELREKNNEAAAAALKTGQANTVPTKVSPKAALSVSTSGAAISKTVPGPRGSLTSDDSSYPSSSDESSNGNHLAANANNPGLINTFPFHLQRPVGSPPWENKTQFLELRAKQQNPHTEQQLAGGNSQKLDRAKGEPKQPQNKQPQNKQPQNKQPQNKQPQNKQRWASNPLFVPEPDEEPHPMQGRDSPYLDPKIPKIPQSSQPEEAWPSFDPLHEPPPQLHDLPVPSSIPIPFSLPITLTTHTPIMMPPMAATHHLGALGTLPPPMMTLSPLTFSPKHPSTVERGEQASVELMSNGTQTTMPQSVTKYTQTSMYLSELKPSRLEENSDACKLNTVGLQF